MNLLIAVCLITMAAGAPLHERVLYSLPLNYLHGSYYPSHFRPTYLPIPLETAAPKQMLSISKPDSPKQEKQDNAATVSLQEIKLILGIPALPEGSSMSINVKIDSSPFGPVVSVSNPTTITSSPSPDDAIIVDVGVDGEEVDEEFEIREPPPGTSENQFENSKDSPFLASMLSG